VLDAVQTALELEDAALFASREVLRRNGNMSSATILFVLQSLMQTGAPGMRGCGMAFGPGLTAETLLFSIAA
jgi:predicted naringenin-chalcone synthase